MAPATKNITRKSIADLSDLYSGGNGRSSGSPHAYRSMDDLIAGRSAKATRQTPQPTRMPAKQNTFQRRKTPNRTMFDILSDPDSAARFQAAKLSQFEDKPHRTIEDLVKSSEHIGKNTVSGETKKTGQPSTQSAPRKTVSPYVGIVEANRDLVIKDGREAFASLRNGLLKYNEAARQFTASIRSLQSGLSARGKALLKRDVEELRGFKQVVQDTLNNFGVKMPAAK